MSQGKVLQVLQPWFTLDAFLKTVNTRITIYSNKRRGSKKVFLSFGRGKEIFLFNLTVFFLSVRKFYSNLQKRLLIVTMCLLRHFLDTELNGRAVKYINHFELKNIAFDEKKFLMLI